MHNIRRERGVAGEIAAGYADEALTLEQTICIAFERALSAATTSKGDGLMAAVGLSAQEADALLKQNNSPVVVACDNSPNSVTLSGKHSLQGQFAPRVDNTRMFYSSYHGMQNRYHAHVRWEGEVSSNLLNGTRSKIG
jgi:acyl transferase domain-containing protein